MALTDVACRGTKPGPQLRKLTDSAGLQLWIFPNGSKLWRYAYRFNGKQRLLALGAYPEVSLAEARKARDAAMALVKDDTDPVRAKKLVKLAAKAARAEFQAVAEEYLAKLEREGRAEKTLIKLRWLLGLVYPVLGPLPIASIKPVEVLAALQAVERRGRYETARRLRSTIGAVFRFAIATGRAETDPTPALVGALTTPKVSHRAAIVEPRRVGALLRAIDGFDGQPTTRFGLQLMALLFPRPGELRLATWSEFELGDAIWRVPAARAKMRREHVVPLSTQAIDLLKQLSEVTGSGPLLLPSVRSARRSISDNALNAALRRMGFGQDEMTAHGFRAMASTLLNESGQWQVDAIERQLAHIDGNNVRRAYARGQHWLERVRMMQWWADYLDRLRTEDAPRAVASFG